MAIVTAHITAVQQLYVAYFNRPADTAGLDYWTNVVAAQKGSTAAVSAAFAAEAEYKTAYANMTNAQVVNQVYQNLFGRPAETAGQNYWADLLDRKVITIDKVVAEIAKGALTTDAEAYENKVAGAAAFTAALDTTAEQNGYRGDAANSQAKAFISSITTDASLTAALAPATLNASVAKVVAAGTPFTLTSGLAALESATAAKISFLDKADGTVDGKVAAGTEAAIGTKVTTATAALDLQVAGDYAAATPGVRAALLADQITANTTSLTAAQKLVADANVEIAKVAGLSAAIATKTAADTAVTNAQKVVSAAAVELAGKVAAFDFQNTTASKTAEVTVNANGTVSISTVTTTDGVAAAPVVTDVIVLVDGKLVLGKDAAGKTVTEPAFPGVTALLAATTAQEAADTALAGAVRAQTTANANVNYLDMNATEKADLEAIRTKMIEFKDVPVAADALPTLAQIATQVSILEANAKAGVTGAQAELDAFKPLVTTYEASATTNTLVANLKTGTDAVTAATKVITDLTKATSDLSAAVATNAELTAANATVAAALKAFTDNGMTTPNEVGVGEIATGASDIFTVGEVSGDITLFGLQGKDSLFIGSEYTLNTGKLSDGNNAVLEAFITTGETGTVITLETSTFGSNATTPEVITITLVGVAATDVVLSNGIITLGTTGA